MNLGGLDYDQRLIRDHKNVKIPSTVDPLRASFALTS
jgi:hypothetical protein